MYMCIDVSVECVGIYASSICTVIEKNICITVMHANLNSATIMSSIVVSDMFRN